MFLHEVLDSIKEYKPAKRECWEHKYVLRLDDSPKFILKLRVGYELIDYIPTEEDIKSNDWEII